MAPFVPDYRLRRTRGASSPTFAVTPADRGDSPLYALLASDGNPARFSVPGDVDEIAGRLPRR